MTIETEPLKKTVEDELVVEGQSAEDTARWNELNKKQDKTPDEINELSKLKENYGKNVRSTITKLDSQKKFYKNESEENKRELEEIKKKYEELEKSIKSTSESGIDVKEKTVVVGGKTFLTDAALDLKLKAGELTEYEAYQHQRSRDKAEAIDEAKTSILKELRKNDEETIRSNDSQKVLSKYPEFSKNHPDHDPNDPLLVKFNQIWQKGYYASPTGMSDALELAEELLGRKNKRPDRTSDFSVIDNDTDRTNDTTGVKIKVSEDEKTIAIRNYHFGGLINPVTGRTYTPEEAVSRYTKEKEERVKSRKKI